jgi:aryl-alcohol dehydrogenase-like predicted oxidoreductase
VSAELAAEVLHAVLDAGIDVIDTAPDYGPSEEHIGRAIAGRRAEYVLASKCGCPVVAAAGGAHSYTAENVIAGVEQSLRRLRTDYLDVVQFHGSPSMATLESEGGLEALRGLQAQGKVRFIGMSGTIPNLAAQVASGAFDVFQVPYSALQREHEALIAEAAAGGAGVLVRGGVARGAPAPDKAWAIRRLPEVAEERPRALWETARLDELLAGATRMEFMLRFTLGVPGLTSTIVGTADPAHLAANLRAARLGPLPADVHAEAQRRLDAAAAG